MDSPLKLKFKIGQIEFEAEGAPDDVNYQRIEFMDKLLPAAVDAMVRSQGAILGQPIIDAPMHETLSTPTEIQLLEQSNETTLKETRVSINEFLNGKGFVSQIDTAIGLIYYNEIMKKCADFSTEDLKQYFKDAKIKVPTNPSDIVGKLVGKSFIMSADEKNRYKLTRTGISFVETFVAKETKEGKSRKARKIKPKAVSSYVELTADDLNLHKYPQVKSLNGSKEQIIMAMYIITAEGKGEWFTVVDLEHVMTNIFELPSSTDQINGVFKRNKSMFKSEQDSSNKKAYRHKLLSGAKDFAQSLITPQTVD